MWNKTHILYIVVPGAQHHTVHTSSCRDTDSEPAVSTRGFVWPRECINQSGFGPFLLFALEFVYIKHVPVLVNIWYF